MTGNSTATRRKDTAGARCAPAWRDSMNVADEDEMFNEMVKMAGNPGVGNDWLPFRAVRLRRTACSPADTGDRP